MLMEIKANVLYTPNDLAEILGFDRRTVQKMLAAGLLPGFKIGRRRWFTLGATLLAMADNDRDAAAELAVEGGQGDA